MTLPPAAPAPHPSPGQGGLGWLTGVGSAALAVGIGAALAVVGLPLLGRPAPAAWVYELTFLAPAGLAMMLAGLGMVARSRARAARAEALTLDQRAVGPRGEAPASPSGNGDSTR